MYNTGVRLGDLNGDGLDDVVLSIYMYNFRDSPTGRNIFPFPFVYIFFNKRPNAELVKPDSPRIDDVRDTVCFKLDFKASLALISLNLTVDEDTFNIDSPELSYSESESLLCFVPSRDWDTSTMIRFCINRLTDMIGTEMDVPWCVNFNDTTGIAGREKLPISTVLNVYPNPFNAVVSIVLSLPNEKIIHLAIYDLKGKVVECLSDSKLSTGNHVFTWDGSAALDKESTSGVFFVKAIIDEEVITEKIQLIK